MFTFSLLGTYFKEFTKLEKKDVSQCKVKEQFFNYFFLNGLEPDPYLYGLDPDPHIYGLDPDPHIWPGSRSSQIWPGSGSPPIWHGSGSSPIWPGSGGRLFLVNIKKYSVGFKQDSDPQHWADLALQCILWVIKVPSQDLFESFREEKRKKGR